MPKLPGDLCQMIDQLCQKGDQFAQIDQHDDALDQYEAAWELLPEPKSRRIIRRRRSEVSSVRENPDRHHAGSLAGFLAPVP